MTKGSADGGGSGVSGSRLERLEFERKIENPKFLHSFKVLLDSFFSGLLIIR